MLRFRKMICVYFDCSILRARHFFPLFLQKNDYENSSGRKIREADAYTIQNEPIASIDLMERAATQCYKWIKKRTDHTQAVSVFCGPGNNGGDGLAIARLLARKGYNVNVFILQFSSNFSADFQINLEQLKNVGGVEISLLAEVDEFPDLPAGSIVIDAIFGSGLSKPVTGFPARVIRHINQSDTVTVAIDIPSGLFADEHSASLQGAIIEADYTLTFQFPKLAFLFPENEQFTGKWFVLPIGLAEAFTDDVEVKNFTIDPEDAASLLKPRSRFSHKGHFGHALLIAGGYGKWERQSWLQKRRCERAPAW
jgi:ADP-dependent NAD(P)H-hydrate dehydratase / NAD(P)H-hydrate epimerase